MNPKMIYVMTLWAALAVCVTSPSPCHGITAEKILRAVMDQNMGESFRTALSITDPTASRKGREFSVWLMGKRDSGSLSYFLKFDQPQEVHGMRFLVLRSDDKPDRCFMYLPASGDTVPVAPDDPNFTIGGSGLTIESMPGFLTHEIEAAAMLDGDVIDGTDCFVVGIPAWRDRSRRILWVAKEDMRVLRIRRLNEDGGVREEANTLSFFKTAEGRYLPREIEIKQIRKNKRIRLFTHHGLFNVLIAEELMNPKLFGSFKWQIESE